MSAQGRCWLGKGSVCVGWAGAALHGVALGRGQGCDLSGVASLSPWHLEGFVEASSLSPSGVVTRDGPR